MEEEKEAPVEPKKIYIEYENAFKYFAEIRSMIMHENNLINQRAAWMWTLQGLLFGSMSFLWKYHWIPVIIISVVGLMSCVSIGFSLYRATQAISELKDNAKNFNEKYETDYILPPIIGLPIEKFKLLLPWYCMPCVLGIAWVGIFWFRLIWKP